MMEFSEGCMMALGSGAGGAGEGVMGPPGFVTLADMAEVSTLANDLDNKTQMHLKTAASGIVSLCHMAMGKAD